MKSEDGAGALPGTEGSDHKPLTEEQIRSATVGEPTMHDAPIELAEYDPRWPGFFSRESDRIKEALGALALRIEHVGSTSVPGLAAKPIIDIVLLVSDSGQESSYVPRLEQAGFVLRIREPDWYEHRLLKTSDAKVNLHVFSEGCPEVDRMLLFRDRLRGNDADRELYEKAKRELASKSWKFVQNYADAKSAVVEGILMRAQAEPEEG